MSKGTNNKVRHFCGECANVEIVTKFNTLSVTGKPTLGRCEYKEFCVILSEPACSHFKLPTTTVTLEGLEEKAGYKRMRLANEEALEKCSL